MNFFETLNNTEFEAVPFESVAIYLSTAVVLGIILMFIAIYTTRIISRNLHKLPASGEAPAAQQDQTEIILGSANVLFLCFGMAGMMILVNNNLARAFAIGAAISIIRFRVKLDSYGLGATLFFGVLVGLACGIGQLKAATLLTITYGAIQLIILKFLLTQKNNLPLK